MYVTVVPIPTGRLLRHRISCSHSMINVSNPEVNMLTNSSTLVTGISVGINLSTKLNFVFVNGSREIYFVDALRNSI